jgi:hypothetical protein
VPYVSGKKFDFKVTTVGAAEILSKSDVYEGCAETGMEPDNPNDGNPLARTVKFLATRFIPAGSSPVTAF